MTTLSFFGCPSDLLEAVCKLKESEIRPPEILSPKGSAFLTNMRSHQKIFHRLAEFGRKQATRTWHWLSTNLGRGTWEFRINKTRTNSPCYPMAIAVNGHCGCWSWWGQTMGRLESNWRFLANFNWQLHWPCHLPSHQKTASTCAVRS